MNCSKAAGAICNRLRTASGFTLIELMIVLAIVAIILTLALPVYTNYTIRAKIGEGLSVAATAKTMVASTCMDNPSLTGLTNDIVGYNYHPSTWVASIEVSESCLAPLITIVTQNTGAADPPPEVRLEGSFESGRVSWTCRSLNTPDYLLPNDCRGS